MLKELIKKNRSYRRFKPGVEIKKNTLNQLIDLARLSPSGANLQPLKYIISNDKETNDLIFPTLAWAGYLVNWLGPAENERPSAYIIILGDKQISKKFGVDHGIAAQSIMLGATELGYGGCIIASIDRKKLSENLRITDRFEILLALAIGKPNETVILDTTKTSKGIRYWREKDDTHHVPKRSLDEIIIK